MKKINGNISLQRKEYQKPLTMVVCISTGNTLLAGSPAVYGGELNSREIDLDEYLPE